VAYIPPKEWERILKRVFRLDAIGNLQANTAEPLVWARKHWANPILEPTGDEVKIHGPCVLRKEDGTYAMLYTAELKDGTWRICLAEGKRPFELTKIGVVLSPDPATWEGSKIAGAGNYVVYDRKNGQYLLYYHNEGVYTGIGLATSPDLRTWTKYVGNPVITRGTAPTYDDAAVSYPSVITFWTGGGIRRFAMVYSGKGTWRGREMIRKVLAYSDDGKAWTKVGPIFQTPHTAIQWFAQVGDFYVMAWEDYAPRWMQFDLDASVSGTPTRSFIRLSYSRNLKYWFHSKVPVLIQGPEGWLDECPVHPFLLLDEVGLIGYYVDDVYSDRGILAATFPTRILSPYLMPSGLWSEVTVSPLDIRDTVEHVSEAGFAGIGAKAAVFIRNALDKDVTIRFEGDFDSDFNRPFDVGPSITVPADSNSYETLTDLVPWLRARIKAVAAPTAGTIAIWMEVL